MVEIVRLKAGEAPPPSGDYLVVQRMGRIRAFDYLVSASPSLAARMAPRTPRDGPGHASQQAALAEARTLAEQHGAPTIYLQAQSILVRPLDHGLIDPL